jgi:quercetin dioxygenase-like cupin family protein
MPDHVDVTNIDALATELLDEARKHHSRRAARTVVSGVAQRATLIALAEGAELDEHVSPTAATLHVVSGSVRLHTTGHEWPLHAGDLAPVPPQRHGLHADTDAAVLLTVALR